LITVGNRLYANAGLNAKLFLTDGASAVQVAEIPNYAISLAETGARLDLYPGAITYHKGKILFGVDNTVTVGGNVGVWSFNPSNRQLILENIVTGTAGTGADGSSNQVSIGALYSLSQEEYLVGWKDYTSPASEGIDYKSGSQFIQSYGGIIETQIPQIGTALGKRTIQSLEFFLLKPLASGEGIRIKYRTNLTASFTTLATIDYATKGAVQADSIPAASITKAYFLQTRIELTSSGGSSPELVRAILKPSN